MKLSDGTYRVRLNCKPSNILHEIIHNLNVEHGIISEISFYGEKNQKSYKFVTPFIWSETKLKDYILEK